LRTYACDWFETAIGYFGRMVKSTRLTVHSFCYAALANEFLYSTTDPTIRERDRPWILLDNQYEYLISRSWRRPIIATVLKKVHLKKGSGTVLVLKPFNAATYRDSSAIAFRSSTGAVLHGRITNIYFDPTPSIGTTEIMFDVMTYATWVPRRPGQFPRYFNLFTLSDSRIIRICATAVEKQVIMFDAPNEEDVVISVLPLYRFS
jgi:hypothetical protein